MTMHKAKGLEFPVVILPFQHGGKGRDTSLTVDNSFGFPFLTTLSKHTLSRTMTKKRPKPLNALTFCTLPGQDRNMSYILSSPATGTRLC